MKKILSLLLLSSLSLFARPGPVIGGPISGGNTSGGSGPTTNSIISIISSNVPVIYVDATTGNDANNGSKAFPLKTIEQATTNSTSGIATLIDVIPNIYWTTNGIWLKPGNWLRAYGSTIMNMATNGTAAFGVITPDNTILDGVYVTNFFKDIRFQLCFGFHTSLNWGSGPTNVLYNNTKGRGDSDCFFWRGTNNSSWTIRNPDWAGKWDSAVWICQSDTPTVTIDWEGGSSVVTNTSIFSPGASYSHAFGGDVLAGTMNLKATLKNVTLVSTNNTPKESIYFINSGILNPFLDFNNCRIVGGANAFAGNPSSVGYIKFNDCQMTNIQGEWQSVFDNWVLAYDGDPNPPVWVNNCLYGDNSSNATHVLYGDELGIRAAIRTNLQMVANGRQITNIAGNNVDIVFGNNLRGVTNAGQVTISASNTVVKAGSNVTITTNVTTSSVEYTIASSGSSTGISVGTNVWTAVASSHFLMSILPGGGLDVAALRFFNTNTGYTPFLLQLQEGNPTGLTLRDQNNIINLDTLDSTLRSGGFKSVDWLQGTLNDIDNGNISIDYRNQNIYANDGTTIQISYGTANIVAIQPISGGVKMTQNTTATATFNTSTVAETIYNDDATLIASLTITLPATSSAGQILRYVTKAAVTSVTVNGTVSIGSAITTFAANSSVAWQATGTGGSFVRIE